MRTIILFIIVLNLLLGCQSGEQENNISTQVPVKIKPVIRKEISLPLNTAGILSASSEMKLSFKTGGIIDKIYADEGEKVQKGAVLASLDLEEIKSRYDQARIAFNKAERDLERIKNLYADSVATLEQLQNTESAYEIAQSNLNIARFNLNHSRITAPLKGIVLKRFSEEKELISPGLPVFLFGSSEDNHIVKTGLTDEQVVRINISDKAHVTFDAIKNKTFDARVTGISGTADPRSSTYEVELELLEQNEQLLSGFVAKIEIYPAQRKDLYLIPVEALVEADRNQGFVYALDENQNVSKSAVQIYAILDSVIAVNRGLENVQQVITEGSSYITENSEIVIEN